jgi:hypothetical protein
MNRERAADIGFVSLGVVLVLMALNSYSRESTSEIFPVGSELPAAYPRSSSPGQVLLAFRSDCQYCIESIPFYMRLATYCQQIGIDFRVLTLESPEAVRAALKTGDEGHLEVVRMSHFDFRGTPALVLVDSQNHVVASWLGWLNPRFEEKVIAAIEELAR